MNSDVVKYVCPECGNDLIFTDRVDQENSSVREGKLVCRTCGIEYPVIGGIPRFVPSENYAGSFGYQWNMHRKTQLDSNSGLPISKNRLFQVTGWSLAELRGQTVLEAGSGSGRFTEVLLDAGARVISFDYSYAVDANYENQQNSPALDLFQGNIFKLPLRKRTFPKVLCLGVLQHTSDPEGAFKSLSLMVAPGGELIIDIYRKDVISMLQWKYLLRPVTKQINKELFYRMIAFIVPILLPIAITLNKIGGKAVRRLMPIPDYSDLGLTYELNKEWSILDTFDMYSPAYDYPQTKETVTRWFREAGMENIQVENGPNGIVGRGRYPSGNH